MMIDRIKLNYKKYLSILFKLFNNKTYGSFISSVEELIFQFVMKLAKAGKLSLF